MQCASCPVPARNRAAAQFWRVECHPGTAGRSVARITGVVRVLIGADFITVVRDGPDQDWATLQSDIALQLLDHFEGERTRSNAGAEPAAIAAAEHFSDIEAQIDAVLERYVRPWLAADGGNALLDRFDPATGTVWVRMEGACGGCPSGGITSRRESKPR